MPSIQNLARRIFALGELSLEEFRSADLLVRFLRAEGFRVRRGVAGLPTAFVARRQGVRPRPRLALLAEYDALPGIGHACGHNLIGAAACGAAAIAARVSRDAGTIVVYGTPAEETLGGKVAMTRRGLFRGLDAALMFHPSTEDRVATTSLACHSLEVTYLGRAAHAVAAPETGINALTSVLRLFAAVDRLPERLPRGARLAGIIAEGGARPNIVPERAVARFTLRARTRRDLARVESAFRSAARRAGRVTGARVRIRPLDLPYDEMRTNETLARIFREELAALGRRAVETPRRRMGSLDMGNVSQVVPAIHPYVAIAPVTTPLHSRAFARRAGGRSGRRGLEVATRALAATALRLIADPEIVEAARREFAAGGGRRRARLARLARRARRAA
ncbi:MAG TPA: amidohydrolase [Patescibacteria group bacterium]|nr:amidohydrolase [Patescibacteria group bacterium]